MPEQIKKILQQIKDWWNKFTTHQKTVIIGLGATVIFAFAILIYVTSQPKYVDLITCENEKKASEVKSLLDDAGIQYKPSDNALHFSVESSQYQSAVWALGSAGYGADEFTMKEALSGGFSTTASDKEKLAVEALQSKISRNLTELSNVKSAEVLLHVPKEDGTLLRERRESSAYVKLELNGTFTSANAANVARAVATWLGNETTANITILDSDSNLLFTGGDDYSSSGIASSMRELQNQGQAMVANQVKNVLYATNQFSQVEVTCNLDMDYSSYERTVKNYSVAEGRDEGYLGHRETYESENTNNGAYAPGTDSNDENVYVDPNTGNSSSTQTEKIEDFLPNEDIMNKITPAGAINYNNSYMSIAMIKYHIYREEDVKAMGLLDGISWKEFKRNNAADIKLEVDQDYYSIAHTATGIPVENITILSYESPEFIDAPGLSIEWTNVASVILLIVILGLLGLVVLRSMSFSRKTTEEEELSVESLLQSTPEIELENIETEGKSETRKLIEKFVDENPEAAAALLRNWLSEDW